MPLLPRITTPIVRPGIDPDVADLEARVTALENAAFVVESARYPLSFDGIFDPETDWMIVLPPGTGKINPSGYYIDVTSYTFGAYFAAQINVQASFDWDPGTRASGGGHTFDGYFLNCPTWMSFFATGYGVGAYTGTGYEMTNLAFELPSSFLLNGSFTYNDPGVDYQLTSVGPTRPAAIVSGDTIFDGIVLGSWFMQETDAPIYNYP